MHVGELIRQKRTELNMTQEQLGNLLGVNRAAINKWETGRVTNLKRETIKKLSEIFQISPALLVEPDGTDFLDSPLLPLPRMKRWEVIGGTTCGSPIHKEIEESILAPADIDADRVFRCVGDSMIGAHIFDGDLVFVKAGADVEDGKIGVVRIGEEYTLKRIYHGADYLELRSENPMYPPIIIRGEQENAEIVGRAVQFLSRVI